MELSETLKSLGMTDASAAELIGVGRPSLTRIKNGKLKPSRSLAIAIYRKTGWRHESIAHLTEKQMRVLEEIEPWGRAA